MHKWTQPLVALVILSVSTLLLTAIFDSLTPYLALPQQPSPPERGVWLNEDERLSPPSRMFAKPSRLIFVVSPADPVLYWRTFTADYYDGLGWYRTTSQITKNEFPSIQRDEATRVFTVELNLTENEISLPVPPPQTDLEQPVLSPPISHEYYVDEVGDAYEIKILGLNQKTTIVYQAGWHYTEIDKWRISLGDIPREIREPYLQLPSLPSEVVQLAKQLKRSGMNAVDQILNDVAYFLIHFEYDLNYHMGRTSRIITRDWVLSYLQWRKGVCLDAATALAVILRCQGIPSRISLGYKPTRIDGDKILYYSNTSHAETEAYLPPYGWVRFDATPFSPFDFREDLGALRPEKGLTMEISPIEATGYPGESVFYHLMVNNSRKTKDHFRLSMHSLNGWDGGITPEYLSIGAFETCDALIEVKIPETASYGHTDVISVTATSTYNPDVKVSNVTIVRVGEVKRVSTITDITYIDNPVFRGDSFYVEGTVSAPKNKLVHDMHVLILLKENKEARGIVCGNGFSQYGFFHIEGQVPFDIEMGDYLVVAISLGTTEYAPSTSDPSVKVLARTYIELDICVEGVCVARPFLVEDRALISGVLHLDNGTILSNATIELEVLAPGTQMVGKQNIIAEKGFFIYKVMFSAPGTYDVNASFAGKGYIDESYSHRKIEVGSPVVQSLTESYCARGEVLSIRGNVSSNNRAVPEEPVTIAFDKDTLATVRTEADGVFSYNWRTKSEVQPGLHLLTYTLQKRKGASVTQYVRVLIKAQVAIDAPEKVTGGNPFTCTISLRDDHGFPIDGEEISAGNYGFSAKTDNLGNIEFMLDTMPLWWGNMNFSATFKGSETYLPSTRFVIITVQPGFVSIIFVLTTSTLFILGLAIYRRKFRRLFPRGKGVEAEVEETYTPPRKETFQTKVGKASALRISFPDIGTPFPNVWGIKDKLRVECTPDRSLRAGRKGKEIELLVNSKGIAKDQLSRNRPATFSHVFDEKGEHEVEARLVGKSKQPSMKVATKLRIVNYREEIIRLYKTFLQHLRQDIDWKDAMTAREIERLLVGKRDFDPKNLQRVADCFERAEYSDHNVCRESYETMYLSLKELVIDVD